MSIISGGLKSIWRKKARVTLTMLGVAIGVFSVMIIITIGDIGKEVINQEMSSIGIDGVMIGVDSTATSSILTEEHVETIDSNNLVKQTMPFMMKYSTFKIHGTTTKAVVFGVEENAEEMISLSLLHGRMITESDINSSENLCVVDESFAQLFYERSNIVGKEVDILLNDTYQKFTIIGVVESDSNVLQGLMGDYIPCFIYAPISSIQQYYSDGYDQIMVKFYEDDTDTAWIEEALKEEFGSNGITIQNLVQQKEKINGLVDTVTVILTIIGAISLLVSGISIMSIMLASVHERTREIGIKKAIGASKLRIMLEFMAESLFICLFGSMMGLTLGAIIAWAGCSVLNLDFNLSIQLMGWCLAFACAIGVVFGVYPAMRAANLEPVEALRTE